MINVEKRLLRFGRQSASLEQPAIGEAEDARNQATVDFEHHWAVRCLDHLQARNRLPIPVGSPTFPIRLANA